MLEEHEADMYSHRMSSSTVASSFWLMWHMMRDRKLLARAVSEVHASRPVDAILPFFFDTTKLCSQPLLQSTYAETLRLYVAAVTLRRPDFGDTQVLDYKIPKDRIMVICSTMAHMDKRNWNMGVMDEHPVESFWADRFLTYNRIAGRPFGSSTTSSSSRDSTPAESTVTNDHRFEPQFSLTGSSGAWIPFGGGTDQCPGRHWVKIRMLITFAMISSAFEIELLGPTQSLKVDTAKYGLGALPPAEKAKFRIRRKPITIH